jgi:PilZ domain
VKSLSVNDRGSTTARGDQRYYAHFSELSFVYEGKFEEVPIRPPDISVQGMFIQTPHHFAEGAVLKVRFRLARSHHEVHARAEVRYCLSGVGIGVEFIEISSRDREAIENELREAKMPPDKF